MIKLANHEHDDSSNMSEHLQTLEEKRRLVKDRVRAVRSGVNPGLFICGPPGTGKSHTVLECCREYQQPSFFYYRGHITPIGLFQLLAEHSNATIVLDDVHAILDNQIALQQLLAALGTPDNKDGSRTIHYKRGDHYQTVEFSGGIIAISNLELRTVHERKKPLLEALAGRSHILKFSPSSDEMAAVMKQLALKGWRDHSGRRQLDADVCVSIAEFVVAECLKIDRRLDLRLLMEKAFPDYWLWSQGETDNHWENLVRASLNEKPLASYGSDRDREIAAARKLAGEIRNQFKTPKERIRAWQEATRTEELPNGRSSRAYYRRIQELDAMSDTC